MHGTIGSSASDRLARLKATTRALTYRYILALSLIATLAMGGFLTLQKIIERHEASSSIINASARQRSLVQEAAAAARHLVESRDRSARAAERATLFEAAHAIEETHRALTDPGHPLGQPVETSERVRALYFADPLNIDRQIRSFVEHAFGLVGAHDHELGRKHPSLQHVVAAASGGLLISLDALVNQLEAEATASVRRSRRLETGLLFATLLLLSLEALFIFRPIVRRVWCEGTRLIQSQDKLVELAHYDPLTRLPNRTLLQIRLGMALAQARRDRMFAAVLQLDLDHFKDVNDTLGHAAGDHLLWTIARRLEGAVRETDTVARLGGDEFVVIVTGLRSIEEVGRIAEKLVALVGEPASYVSTTLHTSTSVGITIYPHDDVEPEQLLKNADIALYQAKERGRNTYSFFVGEMKERITRRKRLESELRRALVSDELEVFYQPQVELTGNRIVSVEALVRWRHPEQALLLPGAFIDVAEETGLIAPLGELVLHRALQQMRRWSDLGVAPERVAVNLSAVQFRRQDIARVVREALADSGLEPSRLELEVTEGVILSRSHDEVVDAMERLHAQGVSFSLDDFGTGYASLTHLNRFSFRRLKIDRSFVRDIGHDPGDAVIVRTVINLGHSLGYEVIAEGVENEEQLAYLKLHGCELIQGFLFAAPMTGEALGQLLLDGGRIDLKAADPPCEPLAVASELPASLQASL